MTFRTRTYDLEAHLRGEIYSASVDRRRFTIIDNQIAFMSDIIGDGRILGYDISVKTASEFLLTITKGTAIIDRFVTQTYGNIDFYISDNKDAYIYLRRKQNVLGGFGGYSNIGTVTPTDVTAPATVTGLAYTGVTYSTISLSWDENSEVDFSEYIVTRSTNNIDFTEIARLSTNSYTDTGLDENTTYYYKIQSSDLTGNLSAATAALMIRTNKNLTVPLPPTGLLAFNSNETIQLVWNKSEFGNLNRYEVRYVQLLPNNQPSGSYTTLNVSTSKGGVVIKGLTNGKRYRFEVYSVSNNEVYSSAVSTNASPLYNTGPSEVSEFNVDYSPGVNDDFEIVANLSWIPNLDPYVEPPAGYEITVFAGFNNIITSEPIIVIDSFNRDIKLLSYLNADDELQYISLSEVQRYVYVIKTIDSEGIRSNGVVVTTTTPSFKKPPKPSNLRFVENDNGDIFASWLNSFSEYFDHNIVRVTEQLPGAGSASPFIGDTDIGRAVSYTIGDSATTSGATYTLYLTAVDRFGNSSDTIESSVTLADSSSVSRPGVPEGQFAASGDGVIILRWDPMNDDLISQYKIWRSDGDIRVSSSSFSVLNTISSTEDEYKDFTIEDGTQYYYFVTAVDIFGQESFNPVDDGFISYKFMFGKSTISNSLGSVAISSVSQSGHDAIITWGAVAGDFDGYEIQRSTGNNYQFEIIGYANKSATSFTDEDALLVGGTAYNYLVRRYRNEAEILVSESSSTPTGSIVIGYVESLNGSITIDQEIVNELLNMRDPIVRETAIQVNAHKHTIDPVSGIDRRIDLSSNIIITDWETNDYKTFTTDEDITGASAFILRINGSVNNAFFQDEDGNIDQSLVAQVENGLPPLLYEISSSGSITFESPLYDDSGVQGVTPYSSEPELMLTLVDVSEVTGIVPASRVSSFSATQVDTGEFDKRQLPSLHHDGRIGENLIPDQRATFTNDNFTFFPTSRVETTTDENGNETQEIIDFRLYDAITFYDIMEVREFQTATEVPGLLETAASNNSALLAATSKGILVSFDFGSSWTTRFSGVTAPSKLYYSSAMDKYLALSNKRVWISSGELNDWSPMAGIENVKVIRDIVEDPNGSLYISTDLGVYKLDIDIINRFFRWDQTPLFGPRSSESYAMLYDNIGDRLLVSNELGILESTTSGLNWSFIDEFSEEKKIWSFVQSGSKIFALTKDAIWRRSSGSFKIVSEIESDISRKLTLFNNRLYVLTSEGVLASANGSNVYEDTEFEMVPVFSNLNINGNRVPATSINVIGNLLVIGTDQKIFFVNKQGRVSIQYDRMIGKIPSVYVDGVLQTIGFRYSNADDEEISHSISFDEKQSVDSVVKVAREYKKYIAKNGGWAFQKFDARAIIYRNRKVIVDTGDEDISITADSFTSFEFPSYEESNSHFDLAEEYQNDAESKIAAFDVLLGAEADDNATFSFDEDEEVYIAVKETLVSIEKFLSMLYPAARAIETEDGTQDVVLPAVSYSFTGVDVVGEETRRLPTTAVNDPSSIGLTDNQSGAPGSTSAVGADGEITANEGLTDEEANDITATIDTTTGTVEFDTEFDKYDSLKIDILGVTLTGTGENTHQEVEDEMELVNSGLWSAFSQAMQSNVVKLGIFNEKNYRGEQETQGIPVQATYIVPRDSTFYDKINSTIDYSLELGNNDINLSLPYAVDINYQSDYSRVLVGGSGGILLVDALTLDIEEVTDPDISGQDIKQFLSADDKLYVITEKNILYSTNGGTTWTKDIRVGLPNNLYSLGFVNGTLVVGAEDGVYFRARQMSQWNKAIDSSLPVEIIINPDLLFVVVDNKLRFTSDGANYTEGGNFLVTPYKLHKFKSIMYSGTSAGLYEDNGTFYSGNVALALIDILDDRVDSAALVVNDIASDDDNMVVSFSNGKAYRFYQGVFTEYEDTGLSSAQRIAVVGNEVWAFGYNKFIIFDTESGDKRTTYPLRLTTGAPL